MMRKQSSFSELLVKTNTSIKKDKWGLYVRTGGYIFRPILTRHSYRRFQPMFEKVKNVDPYIPDLLLFKEGEKGYAKHISQSPDARIKTPDGREAYWASHGSYYGKRPDGSYGIINSEICWHENENHKM